MITRKDLENVRAHLHHTKLEQEVKQLKRSELEALYINDAQRLDDPKLVSANWLGVALVVSIVLLFMIAGTYLTSVEYPGNEFSNYKPMAQHICATHGAGKLQYFTIDETAIHINCYGSTYSIWRHDT